MNILVTSAGQRVSLVRAFQKELKKIYPDGKVFTTDMCPPLSAACRISDGYIKVKPVTDRDYIPELLENCRSYKIGMIIPTIDTELLLLAENARLFSENEINLIISSSEFIAKCRDKRKTTDFFKRHDIHSPALLDKHNPTFPLFIKPYDGSRSIDTHLIRKEQELTPYYLSNEKLLFMEYINAANHDEYTVDMYYGKDHQVKCIVPRKRIKVRDGEINKGITCKSRIVSFLKEKLAYIEGAIGCLTLQLFLNKNTGRIIAFEINPRFGGGYPLSYLAGANYPKWLIQEHLLNRKIDYYDGWEDNLLMLRYDDEVLIHDYTDHTT